YFFGGGQHLFAVDALALQSEAHLLARDRLAELGLRPDLSGELLAAHEHRAVEKHFEADLLQLIGLDPEGSGERERGFLDVFDELGPVLADGRVGIEREGGPSGAEAVERDRAAQERLAPR